MILMQVGFIAQLKGSLTKKHCTVATVFVDHYSRLKYIHLMTKLSSEETIEAKQAFEHFTKPHGIRILHYHCNNGRFADNAFKNSCSAKGQRLTFCGVNARFQNGIVERPSGTSERVHRSSSSMHANAGLQPSTWPSGHMHLGVLFTFTILHLF